MSSCPPKCSVQTAPNTVSFNISVVEPTAGREAAWSSGAPGVVPRSVASTSPGIIRNADSQALAQAY